MRGTGTETGTKREKECHHASCHDKTFGPGMVLLIEVPWDRASIHIFALKFNKAHCSGVERGGRRQGGGADVPCQWPNRVKPCQPWFRTFAKSINEYCLSKKSWPILYKKLQFEMSQDFLDTQYKNEIVQYYFLFFSFSFFLFFRKAREDIEGQSWTPSVVLKHPN